MSVKIDVAAAGSSLRGGAERDPPAAPSRARAEGSGLGGARAALLAGSRAAGGGRDEPGEAGRREEETSQGGNMPKGGGAAPPLVVPPPLAALPGSETLARVRASSHESRLPSGMIRETVTKEIGSEGYHGLFV